MNKLKPCPFCGAEAEVYTRTQHVPQLNNPQGTLDALWVVDCTECDANIEFNESQKSAIEKWNNRPEEARLKRVGDANMAVMFGRIDRLWEKLK